MTRKEANVIMRSEFGALWFEIPGIKEKRNALMRGEPLNKSKAKSKVRTPSKTKASTRTKKVTEESSKHAGSKLESPNGDWVIWLRQVRENRWRFVIRFKSGDLYTKAVHVSTVEEAKDEALATLDRAQRKNDDIKSKPAAKQTKTVPSDQKSTYPWVKVSPDVYRRTKKGNWDLWLRREQEDLWALSVIFQKGRTYTKVLQAETLTGAKKQAVSTLARAIGKERRRSTVAPEQRRTAKTKTTKVLKRTYTPLAANQEMHEKYGNYWFYNNDARTKRDSLLPSGELEGMPRLAARRNGTWKKDKNLGEYVRSEQGWGLSLEKAPQKDRWIIHIFSQKDRMTASYLFRAHGLADAKEEADNAFLQHRTFGV